MWYGVDPMSDKEVRSSPYNFSLNQPIKYKDPDGKIVPLVGALIGAVVGGTASIITQKIKGQKINWKSVAVSAGQGALVGALPVASLGAVGTGLAAGGIGFASDVVDQTWAEGKKLKDVNYKKSLFNGAISGITAGFAAGKFTQLRNKSISSMYSPTTSQLARSVNKFIYNYPGAAGVVLGSSVDIGTATIRGVVEKIGSGNMLNKQINGDKDRPYSFEVGPALIIDPDYKPEKKKD